MHEQTLRDHARAIFMAGLHAADAARAVARVLDLHGHSLRVGETLYPVERLRRIRVVGVGKASAAMAQPLEEVLGERIESGLVIVKEGHGRPLGRVQIVEAGHPVPNQAGVSGVEALLSLLEEGSPRDLLFCLISGGGSALSPAPIPGLTLAEKQEMTRLLLSSGATIHEMNAIRKHLSRVKGGRLARLAAPVQVHTLILSDVVGDDLDTIASGPTVPDRSTYGDCLEILERRELLGRAPSSVVSLLKAGTRGELPETPKEGDPAFSQVHNLVVGNNAMALEAAVEKARDLGYRVLLPSDLEEGEARDVARSHVALAKEMLQAPGSIPIPCCILSGGETTVRVRGEGLGGRNQELALAAALEMKDLEGTVVLSGGTDGTDGPTDAAGALADGRTVARGRALGMDAADYLDRNDSYRFFHPLGDLLMTGPTFTNVMDLRVVLVGSSRRS